MAKPSSRQAGEVGREVWTQLENINRFGYGYAAIFSDWLDLMLNSLLSLTANVHRPEILELVRTNALDDQYTGVTLVVTGRTPPALAENDRRIISPRRLACS